MSIFDADPVDGATADTDFGVPTETADEPLYTVKVQGEERQVSLKELQDGYMRQADYTIKTQDLANQRSELEQYRAVMEAFESNPEAATRALAQYYGFDPVPDVQPQTMTQPQYDDWGDPIPQQTPQVDPVVAELRQEINRLQGDIRSLTTSRARDELTGQAKQLAEKYPDVDPEVALRHATTQRFPTLELAFKDLAFEARNEAYLEHQRRLQSEAQVIESKRGASVVNPGSGPAAGAVQKPSADFDKLSFGETFKQVASEMNVDLSNSNFVDL